MSVSSITATSKKKLKIVFLGNQNVGKTCIINRFVNNKFQEGETPTIGIDFLVTNFTCMGKTYRLQLWDTAGQQRFKSLIPSYLKDSHCAVVVYDVTNKESFENAFQWMDLYCQNQDETSFGVIVGNKIDNEEDKFDGFGATQERCKEQGIEHMLISAKTSQNLKEMFQKLVQTIISNKEKASNDATNMKLLQGIHDIHDPNVSHDGPIGIGKENGDASVKTFMTPRGKQNLHNKAVKLAQDKKKENEEKKKKCCGG